MVRDGHQYGDRPGAGEARVLVRRQYPRDGSLRVVRLPLFCTNSPRGTARTQPITRALDTRAFYIVPRVNPDGAELYFADKPNYIRSCTRPYPYDEEPIDGLKYEDVDGDGRMLQMRIPDPNGAWKIAPGTSAPAGAPRSDRDNERQVYYRVLPEGVLENWDGMTLELQKNKEGLDLNRNFPANWRQEGEQFGAGPFPGSEPEVVQSRQVYHLAPQHHRARITFHTFSGVLLRPYGTQADDAMPAEDLWTFQAIGKQATEMTGYPAISVYHDFRYHPKEVITGVFDDWMYDHLGVYAWTCEIWSPQRQAGLTEGFDKNTKPGAFKFIDWGRNHPIEDDIKMLEWSDTQLDGKGYRRLEALHASPIGRHRTRRLGRPTRLPQPAGPSSWKRRSRRSPIGPSGTA